MTTTRSIDGKPVGSIGYGLLGLTIPWAPVEYEAAAKLLKTALENGANVWNGSTHYGTADANSTQPSSTILPAVPSKTLTRSYSP